MSSFPFSLSFETSETATTTTKLSGICCQGPAVFFNFSKFKKWKEAMQKLKKTVPSCK